MQVHIREFLILCGVTLTLATVWQQPAHAEDGARDQWQFYFTPYLWLSGLSGTASTANPVLPSQNLQASFGDILSHLDAIPVVGAAEARYGRFGLSLDVMRLALQSDFATRNVLFSDGNARMTQFFASVLGSYRVVQSDNQALDLGAGVRPWSVTTKLTFNPGLFPGFSRSKAASWADPIIAARYHADFSDQLGATFYADVGGFGAGSQITWQVLGTLDYRVTDWLVLRAGYRHLRIEYHGDVIRLDTALSGPILGTTFRF